MTFVYRCAPLAAALMCCAVTLPVAPAMAQQPMQAAARGEDQPPLMENLGRLVNGDALLNFDVRTVGGTPGRIYDYVSGKTALIVLWPGARGPGEETLRWLERLSADYGAQGLKVVGIGTGAEQADFDRWMADNRSRLSFPVVRDPVGRPPMGPPREDMTPEEKDRDFELFRQYTSATIAGRLGRRSGGLMQPAVLVVDADGRFVGWTFGGMDRLTEGVGNLLLRVGLKVNDKDRPARVWTREETRPPESATVPPIDPAQLAAKFLTPGTDAPDFTALDIDNKPVKLSDFKGKVVVLDFWATWCGPCIAGMPEGSRVAQAYKDQDVVVVGVCVKDRRTAFERWIPGNQSKYPGIHYLHDPMENNAGSPITSQYGITGIPMQYVIGRDGKVKASLLGYSEGEVLLEGALAKAGVKVDPAIVAKAEEQQRKRQSRRATPSTAAPAAGQK